MLTLAPSKDRRDLSTLKAGEQRPHVAHPPGFTLVEVMIVVVIIGLLASLAIPAIMRNRRSTYAKIMLNDARQIGSAAQQYFMETGLTQVTFSYTAATGVLGGPLTAWVGQLRKNYTVVDSNVEATATAAFSLQLQGAFGDMAQTFDPEGRRTSTDAE